MGRPGAVCPTGKEIQGCPLISQAHPTKSHHFQCKATASTGTSKAETKPAKAFFKGTVHLLPALMVELTSNFTWNAFHDITFAEHVLIRREVALG